VGAGWLQTALVSADEELPNLVGAFRRQGGAPPDTESLFATFTEEPMLAPVSEQALAAYNESGPPVPITAIPVADAPALDFPYAVLARQPLDIQTAASRFRATLTGAGEVFARHGFQPPGELTPVTAPEELQQALRIWT